MERKVVAKKGPSSPRSEMSEEEDVFDYARFEDFNNESGPVPREAYAALRKAFRSLEKRLHTAEAKVSELTTKLKQKERKGSHEQVYQERDALQNHLHNSYLAFEEKFGENEKLKKIIQELQLSQKETQKCITKGKGGAQSGPTSERKETQEGKKYTDLVVELKAMGLEIAEEIDQQFIILVERDNLKKWIEEKSDGNLTITIQEKVTENNANQTETVASRVVGYEQSEGKRKKLEAEVILLKQKIEDQAQELNRFYKIFKEVMVQNKELRAREQRNEREAGGVTKEASKPEEAPAAKRIALPTKTGAVVQKRTETILSTAQQQVAEMKKVREHLKSHDNSLQKLAELTEKTTEDFLKLIRESQARPVGAESSGYPTESRTRWPVEGETSFTQRQRIEEVGNFERLIAEDAPLSIPVQEASEYHRLTVQDETGATGGFGRRLNTEKFLSPISESSSDGAEGRAVPMGTVLSENTGTGESDIEVIDEEDFIGATPVVGKICPMCERFFPESYGQRKFEDHVQQHFVDDS